MLTVVAGISARYSKFAFVLFCYITNHLMTVLRKPIRDNPKIFTKSEKMFLKSEKVFQIVMFFGNRRRRVYQI